MRIVNQDRMLILILGSNLHTFKMTAKFLKRSQDHSSFIQNKNQKNHHQKANQDILLQSMKTMNQKENLLTKMKQVEYPAHIINQVNQKVLKDNHQDQK